MDEQTYWNGNGKLQSTYTKEWNELVPASGKAGSLQGEVLRAASRLYYRWFNDGDRISNGGLRVDSSAEDAWGFLHNAIDLLPGNRQLALVRHLTENTAMAVDEQSYEAALEALANAAITFAASRPLVPTEADFAGGGWNEVCVDECNLQAEEDED